MLCGHNTVHYTCTCSKANQIAYSKMNQTVHCTCACREATQMVHVHL